MVKRYQYIDDDTLSELSSLTHLLERNDNDDNDETPILKHSPFYSENQFIDIIARDPGLSILDINICDIFRAGKNHDFFKKVMIFLIFFI